MSEQTRTRQQGGSVNRRQLKAERRAAYQAAAQAAAEARQRRNALLGALAGVIAVGLIVGAFFVFRDGKTDDSDTASSKPSSQPSTTAAATAPAVQLPADADPALKTKPAVTAGSGELSKLTVTPLIQGTGPAVQSGQTITVNYVGVSYRTGEEFDASWKRSQPASFPIGVGQVIPGWDQGLVGVKVGSRVQLDIPSNLAYGDDASGGRPTGPLRFVVDILGAQ